MLKVPFLCIVKNFRNVDGGLILSLVNLILLLGILFCCWGSPDPQRSDCGFTIHAGHRPAVILLWIWRSTGTKAFVLERHWTFCRWKISFCRWGFYFVVWDLRIPNALTVDLQSTRVTGPQLFSCGSGDPQGQRHSYCNGMGILSL